MALWDKIGSVGNVEDRRGAGLALGGGTVIVGIIAYLVLGFLGVEIDPAILNQVLNSTQTTSQSSEFAGTDDYERFASSVLGSTNDYWRQEFTRQGRGFDDPTLVLFRSATQSGCGVATSQVGPHYCPTDKTIYLDETFFTVLRDQLGGSSDDVAQAYVIAHEAGHHAQDLLGILGSSGSSPSDSVRTELQADCFAGLWANSLRDSGVFEPGEIKEAIDAAAAVGDDRIQKTTTGSINPETWTHGSSEQRVNAFNTGYDTGNFSECSKL